MTETTLKCAVCCDPIAPLTSGVFQYDCSARVQFLCQEHANYIDRLIGDLSEDFECNA